MCAPGRIRTFVGLRPPDLQSGAIDHSATDAYILIVARFEGHRRIVFDTVQGNEEFVNILLVAYLHTQIIAPILSKYSLIGRCLRVVY